MLDELSSVYTGKVEEALDEVVSAVYTGKVEEAFDDEDSGV